MSAPTQAAAQEAAAAEVCDNCPTKAATIRLTPKDADDVACDCGEALLEHGGVLTLCQAKCPNFAFSVFDFNAAKTAAKVEMDDHVECAACGKGSHCVRAAPPAASQATPSCMAPPGGSGRVLTLPLPPPPPFSTPQQVTYKVAVEWIGKK